MKIGLPTLRGKIAALGIGVSVLTALVFGYVAHVSKARLLERSLMGDVHPSDVTSLLNEDLATMALIGLGVCTAIGILTAIVARALVAPLAIVTKAANRLTAGERWVRCRMDRSDEIGQLGTALDTVASTMEEALVGLEEVVRRRTCDLEQAVAEHKATTEALQASEERFRAVFESTTDCVLVWDRDHNCLYANQAAIDHVGTTRDRVVGKNIRDGLWQNADFVRLWVQRIDTVFETGEGMRVEDEALVGDRLVYSESVLSPIRRTDGGVFAVGAVHRDVTERRRTELALVAEREQLISMFDGIDEVVYVADPTTHELLYLNKPAKEHWGDRVGEKCHCVLQERDTPCPFCTNDRLFGDNGRPSHIWEFQNEKNRRWYRCIDKAIRWPNGRMVRFELAIDITERKQADEEVERQAVRLQAANRELEAFAYSVSHDLRAPLRSISGFAQIIAKRHRRDLNEEGRHYFDNIVQAGEHMGVLIEDLLSYSRLGRGALRRQPVPLGEVLARVLDNLAERVTEAKASVAIPDDLPVLNSDPTLLGAMLTNLFENALKYRSSARPAEVAMHCRCDDDNIVIGVSDNGIGIPPEYHEKVFDVFQRLHSQDDYPGTGVGLAIVKKVAGLLGGRAWVESEPGEGSTFYVELPVESVAAEPTLALSRS